MDSPQDNSRDFLNLQRKPCYNIKRAILAFFLVVIFLRTFPDLVGIINWFSFFTKRVGRVVKWCLLTVKPSKVQAELHGVQQCKARV